MISEYTSSSDLISSFLCIPNKAQFVQILYWWVIHITSNLLLWTGHNYPPLFLSPSSRLSFLLVISPSSQTICSFKSIFPNKSSSLSFYSSSRFRANSWLIYESLSYSICSFLESSSWLLESSFEFFNFSKDSLFST